MVDTTYTIHTKSNGDYFAEYNLGDLNSIERGATTSFTFEIGDLGNDITYTSDTTIESGETQQYQDVTVATGTTLTVNGTLRCETLTVDGTLVTNGDVIVRSGGYEAWLSYQEWGGNYSTIEMLNGVQKYSLQIPTDENIDSIVIGIEPSDDLKSKDVEGIWGIVDSIEDARNPSLNTFRFTVNMYILGQYNDYTDFTDLENNLEVNP